jgi:hypothetical protein
MAVEGPEGTEHLNEYYMLVPTAFRREGSCRQIARGERSRDRDLARVPEVWHCSGWGLGLLLVGESNCARSAAAPIPVRISEPKFLPGVRCSFFDQSCNLRRSGDVDRVTGA